MRLTVRDIAGNVTEAVTREPVLVDPTKPKGVIKGFSSMAPVPTFAPIGSTVGIRPVQ
jgi:hypothetical protein